MSREETVWDGIEKKLGIYVSQEMRKCPENERDVAAAKFLTGYFTDRYVLTGVMSGKDAEDLACGFVKSGETRDIRKLEYMYEKSVPAETWEQIEKRIGFRISFLDCMAAEQKAGIKEGERLEPAFRVFLDGFLSDRYRWMDGKDRWKLSSYVIDGTGIPEREKKFSELESEKIKYDLCFEAVKKDGILLANVSEKLRSQEACMEAVRQNAVALEFVPEKHQTPELCIPALEKDGRLLRFISEKMRTPEIMNAAVKQNGMALQYMPEGIRPELLADTENVKKGTEKPEEVQKGITLRYVKNDNSGTLIVPEKTAAAVKHCGYRMHDEPER